MVYCFQPRTGECRVAADGFFRPNGITFSPDLGRCYVTDTGAGHGDGHTSHGGQNLLLCISLYSSAYCVLILLLSLLV